MGGGLTYFTYQFICQLAKFLTVEDSLQLAASFNSLVRLEYPLHSTESHKQALSHGRHAE
jgi:flagellar hook assembly protein FlgD